ncbi:10483_t:CDS:1, partial [Cetraspora pellucida]
LPDQLIMEEEWRSLGVKKSPHILLFKHEKDYQFKYGIPQPQDELVEQDNQNVQYEQNSQYQQNIQYRHQYHHQNVQFYHQNVQTVHYQQNAQYQQYR